MINNKKIFLYDSTLRDGAQTKGVDFSLSDKIAIAKELDKFGLDYIEGGWPGANNTDTAFFKKSLKLKFSKLVSFGMTNKNTNSFDKEWKEFDKIMTKNNISRKECLLLPINTTLDALNKKSL